MRVEEIERVIITGNKIKSSDIKDIIIKLVRNAYVYSGLHRNKTKEQFDGEVMSSTDAILTSLQFDRRYDSLRVQELEICFLEGFRGTFGKETTYLCTLDFLRWIEAYFTHPIRRDALIKALARIENNQKKVR